MQLSRSKVNPLLLSTKYWRESSIIFAPVMYRLLRWFLFLFPPEGVHYFSMNCLKLLTVIGLRKLLFACFKPRLVRKDAWIVSGLRFPNPVGLGAGFDKSARYLRELESLGFGFVEIGTVTPEPQAGNEKPRLFRLPEDKALINRMGFNNDGVEKIARRLKTFMANRKSIPGLGQSGDISNTNCRLIIGGNIGKNKSTPNEDAWKDYAIGFTRLHPYVDYFVVNVSSPNTPGLRELQEKESLRKILTHLQNLNDRSQPKKPLFLKIAPDLSQEQMADVVDLAMEIKLDGLVVTNTTISRPNLKTPMERVNSIGAGGLSGLPLKEVSTDAVKYITKKTGGRIPIIASGGIFTAADAREKLDAGASLVQVWTGFVYEGPGIVKRICKNM